MTMDDTEQKLAPLPTIAEASIALEKARAVRIEAENEHAEYAITVRLAIDNERAAYRAFNAAVEAMRPKRPRKATAEGGAA